ncbi:MAG TPA: hypothetical protein PKH37_07955 [Alphaproteobacteria bacterium]|nr:hypothetical protein [Alphaproteobacteria bacterium]
MLKYFHFARIAFGDHMSNRLRMFTRFLIYLVLLWVMVEMWRVIYHSGHAPHDIPFVDMAWYMGIAQMMFFLSPRLFVIIDDDVRSGNLGYFLNRPIPYLWMRFTEGGGALCGNVLIYYSAGTLLAYLYIGELPSNGWGALVLVMVLIFVASLIHLLFQVISGLSALWTNDAIFIYHSYQKMFLLLGGIYVPISLYPDFMGGTFLKFLPFAAMVGDPCSLFLSGHTDGFWSILALQIFWLIAVGAGAWAMFGRALRKVEINGG